jgi:adenosylhomocysteine nucleosidase
MRRSLCPTFFLGLAAILALQVSTVFGAPAASVDVLLAAASDAELQPLLDKMQSPQTETHAAWKFWLGTLAGKRVALTRTEGDPLNAVAATTLAIRRYTPKLVVTFGTARAHDPALQPGDLMVSNKFAAFDGMVSSVAPLDGGSNPLTWHKLPHLLATAGEKETAAFFFPADDKALEVAKTLAAPRGKVVVGVLGSAEQVNREADRIAWIRTQWGTSTEDGESAHIAGCAQLLGVPVIGLRVIDGTESEAGAVALHFMEALK